MEALSKAVEPISTVLAKVANKNPEDVGKLLDAELTDAQAFTLEVASNQTAFAVKARVLNLKMEQKKVASDPVKSKEIQQQIEKLQPIEQTINDLDVALSTMTGRRLQARQEGGNTGLLRTLTSKDRTFTTVMKARLIGWNQQKEIKDLNVKIEAARQRGDVVGVIKALSSVNQDNIIITSARNERHRDVTMKQLELARVDYDAMYLRDDGDMRPDDIVKEELLGKIRADGYNPTIAFDDRNQVVNKWRELGINCYQVRSGDF